MSYQIGAYGQGAFGNVSPQVRHISGIKVRPYAITKQGILFANGQTVIGNAGNGPTPAHFGMAHAVNIPKCCNPCY